MRTNRKIFSAAVVEPASILAPLDLSDTFGRTAPLEVDLGCGDGAFLVALAQQDQARDFLGVERLAGRWRGASRKIGHLQLGNARILRAEILHALQHLLPPKSVDVFHLLFPDPWPKRRHETRRIFNPVFLRAIARALKEDGILRVVTDDAAYFRVMQATLVHAPMQLRIATEFDASQLPSSTFGERFRERGTEIHQLALRKR